MTIGTTNDLDVERPARRRIGADDAASRHEAVRNRYLAVLVISLVAAALIVVAVLLDQRDQGRRDFQLKAAEVVMRERTQADMQNRATSLKKLFGDRLPRDFEASFVGPKLNTDEIKAKKELMQLLADHPRERSQIIDTWKQAFPDDKWVDRLTR